MWRLVNHILNIKDVKISVDLFIFTLSSITELSADYTVK